MKKVFLILLLLFCPAMLQAQTHGHGGHGGGHGGGGFNRGGFGYGGFRGGYNTAFVNQQLLINADYRGSLNQLNSFTASPYFNSANIRYNYYPPPVQASYAVQTYCPPPVQASYAVPAYCPPPVQASYAVPAYCPPPVQTSYATATQDCYPPPLQASYTVEAPYYGSTLYSRTYLPSYDYGYGGFQGAYRSFNYFNGFRGSSHGGHQGGGHQGGGHQGSGHHRR